jgi:NAD(P)-dependent dehydrogenase (short-subunit alcohol dehydrogenase family)
MSIVNPAGLQRFQNPRRISVTRSISACCRPIEVMKANGQIVLITGVGTDIGRSIACAFARNGSNVIVMARIPHRAQNVAADAAAHGVKAIAFPGDCCNRSDLRAMARTAMEMFGKIDVLVHAAAISSPHPAWTDSPPDEGAAILEATPMATIFAVNAVMPHMLAQGNGAIVNFCVPDVARPFPRYRRCEASSAALARFTAKTSEKVASFGVRINTIAASLWNLYAADVCRPVKTFGNVGLCTQFPNQAADGENLPKGATDLALFLAGEGGGEITGRVITANLLEWEQVPESREGDRAASIML